MKILSNKKYNELILKSCKGMFGAVTDDMLLRENALLNEENKQLKELCNKYEEEHKTTFETWLKERKVLNELEEWLEDNWKSTQDIWYVKIINKMQELKEKYNYK